MLWQRLLVGLFLSGGLFCRVALLSIQWVISIGLSLSLSLHVPAYATRGSLDGWLGAGA